MKALPHLCLLQTGGETQFPEPYMTNDDEELYKLRIPEPIKRNEKPLDIYAVIITIYCRVQQCG